MITIRRLHAVAVVVTRDDLVNKGLSKARLQVNRHRGFRPKAAQSG